MKTKCIIVDDEPLAIEVIESHLKKFNDIEIVSTCNDAIEAFEILKKRQVDLMFLDIQMPQITGLDFLKSLSKPPKVILTTAYRQYALDGYELDVVDYLLKPVSFERFMKAINKYYQYTNDSFIVSESVQTSSESDSYMYVKSDKKIVKILLKDIQFIESLKDYVQIHTTKKSIVTKNQIGALEEKLPVDKFVRIHKSYIVSISHIDAFTSSTIEIKKKELPIGRSYKNAVLKTLNYPNKNI
jgi:DNA-binding LytR/AlgR family response regulator